MKIAVLTVLAVCLLLYVAGLFFYLQDNTYYQEKAIGYGTLILFFVLMPLFLWWRYSKKFINRNDDEIN